MKENRRGILTRRDLLIGGLAAAGLAGVGIGISEVSNRKNKEQPLYREATQNEIALFQGVVSEYMHPEADSQLFARLDQFSKESTEKNSYFTAAYGVSGMTVENVRVLFYHESGREEDGYNWVFTVTEPNGEGHNTTDVELLFNVRRLHTMEDLTRRVENSFIAPELESVEWEEYTPDFLYKEGRKRSIETGNNGFLDQNVTSRDGNVAQGTFHIRFPESSDPSYRYFRPQK